MKYIVVNWKRHGSVYPTVLYSELDDAGWEIRKVEVFSDNRVGYATQSETSGGTRLSSEPLPSLAQIAIDPQFEPREIDHGEFEQVWARRNAK